MFDGQTVAQWQIDGDHEIIDGTLILGGKRATRARLPIEGLRGFEVHLHYRTEGKESSGIGWDTRAKNGNLIPGVSVPILTPRQDWHDTFLIECFEIGSPLQRFLKHEMGANGVFAPIESVWIEVPAGHRLLLRNVRVRHGQPAQWQWLLATLPVVAMIVVVIRWRWKKRQKSNSQAKGDGTVQISGG